MVTFEEAVDTLLAMFPTWDVESLKTILISKNGHVERAIETILSMEDSSVNETFPIDSNNKLQYTNTGTDQNLLEPFEIPETETTHVHSHVKSPQIDARYRGIKCVLPNDFLKVFSDCML